MTTFLTKIFHRRRPRISGWAVFEDTKMLCVKKKRKEARYYAERRKWITIEPHSYFITKIKFIKV